MSVGVKCVVEEFRDYLYVKKVTKNVTRACHLSVALCQPWGYGYADNSQSLSFATIPHRLALAEAALVQYRDSSGRYRYCTQRYTVGTTSTLF